MRMAKIVAGLSVLGLIVACSSATEPVASSAQRLDVSGSGSSDDRDGNGRPIIHHTGIGAPGGHNPLGGPYGVCFFTAINGRFDTDQDKIVIDIGPDGNWEVWGDRAVAPGPSYAYGCIKLTDFTNGGIDNATDSLDPQSNTYAHQAIPELDVSSYNPTDQQTWCSFGTLSGKMDRAEDFHPGGAEAYAFDCVGCGPNTWTISAGVDHTETCQPGSGLGCEPKDASCDNLTWCNQWNNGKNLKYAFEGAVDTLGGHNGGPNAMTPVATSFCYIDHFHGVMGTNTGVSINDAIIGGVDTWQINATGAIKASAACVSFNQQ
jgi:hypothetical protein